MLSERILSQSTKQTIMNSQDIPARVYVLVKIQPGKEKEFAEVLANRLILNAGEGICCCKPTLASLLA